MVYITDRRAWALIATAAAALAVASLILTPLLKLHPCHLCIFQRLLFMLIAAFAGLAALGGGAQRFGYAVSGLSVVGGATAGYQSWLQAQPADDLLSCGGGDPGLIERMVNELGQAVPSLFMATGFCEDEELVIFGLSLANWAFVAYAGMAMLSLWLLYPRSRAS